MENSLLGLAVYERTGDAVVRGSEDARAEMSSDPLIDSALAQAKSLEQHSDLLTRLSLYEHRLNRTLEKAKAELKQLQKERVEARERPLSEPLKSLSSRKRSVNPGTLARMALNFRGTI